MPRYVLSHPPAASPSSAGAGSWGPKIDRARPRWHAGCTGCQLPRTPSNPGGRACGCCQHHSRHASRRAGAAGGRTRSQAAPLPDSHGDDLLAGNRRHGDGHLPVVAQEGMQRACWAGWTTEEADSRLSAQALACQGRRRATASGTAGVPAGLRSMLCCLANPTPRQDCPMMSNSRLPAPAAPAAALAAWP